MSLASLLELLIAQYATAVDGGHLCTLCGKVIASRILRHLQETHREKTMARTCYVCPSCQSPFSTRSSFSNHVYRMHKDWKGLTLDTFLCKKQ